MPSCLRSVCAKPSQDDLLKGQAQLQQQLESIKGRRNVQVQDELTELLSKPRLQRRRLIDGLAPSGELGAGRFRALDMA